MKKQKKTLTIEKFEVARFANTSKILGGGETTGNTTPKTSKACRDHDN